MYNKLNTPGINKKTENKVHGHYQLQVHGLILVYPHHHHHHQNLRL